MEKPEKPWHFKPGNSGGPGRPKGSRNKLGEDFLSALHEDFQENGASAIKECREKEPSTYVRVIASILPKQVEADIGDNLAELLRELNERRERQASPRLAEVSAEPASVRH